MKNVFKVIIVFLFALSILLVAIQRQYNDFNVNGIKGELLTGDITSVSSTNPEIVANVKHFFTKFGKEFFQPFREKDLTKNNTLWEFEKQFTAA